MGLKGVAQKGKGISDKGKGKAVAGNDSSAGKRKRDDGNENSGGGSRRRNDPGVLRFFDDAAAEADGSDASDENDFINDFMEEEPDVGPNVASVPGNSFGIPIIPKEEEMDEEEFDKMMEDRYKNSSAFFKYPENDFENKRSIDRNSLMPSEKDPIIWKVKCAVGRERFLAFCLMQKYVDLKSLGNKLQIVSAFAVEHVKGIIFIETDKQSDINEACNGLGGVYASRVMPVPRNELSHLLSVRSEYNQISVGMWARVKNGIYKGDLGQIVAVNNSRKRATVKLIPRIDLQAMTEKFGGGVTAKRTSSPAPRLISSSELEEFRPLIQTRRDRDTGKFFEVLDGLMIKDGFLFKKVSIDSLSCWNAAPSKEELLKFKTSENNEYENMEWLSQLYGGRQKRRVNSDNAVQGEKGEGSSGPISTNSFEVHDLVCFGRKDFGVIIGMEKDDTYKILKEGLESPLVVTVQQRELKCGPSNMKFTALDHRMKSISVNDTVRVREGPFEGKQGIVKLIYRGTIFLYDQNEEENGGYFCCKSRICEKVKLSDTFNEKGKESGSAGFEDFFSSSPKSPLSPEKPQQGREFKRDFNQAGEDGAFSIGQSLRIRVGPLKGYRCRVLAIRRSDVTVKLESKHKVLTVKSEHLSEVQTRSSVVSFSEDPGSTPFDMLGNGGGSIGGAAGANDGWNVGWSSGERSPWPTTSASGFTVQSDSGWGNPSSSNDEIKAGVEDGWASKVTPKKNMSWGTNAADCDQTGGWGKSMDSKEKDSSNDASTAWEKKNDGNGNQDDPWGKAKNASNNSAGGWGNTSTEKNQASDWGKSMDSKEKDSSNDASGTWEKKNDGNGNQEDPWGKAKNSSNNSAGAWGDATTEKNQASGWGKSMEPKERYSSNDASSTWEKNDGNGSQDHEQPSEDPWGKAKNASNNSAGGWGNTTTEKNQLDSWSKGKGVVEGGTWESKSGFGASNHGSNDMPRQKSWDTGKQAGDDASAWGNNRQSQDNEWGKRSGGSSKLVGNKDAGWSMKSNWNSDRGDTGGAQVSNWGKKHECNSGSGGTGLDHDLVWGKTSGCSSDGDSKQEKNSESNTRNVWNSKSDSGSAGGNQDTAWGKKSSWNSEPSGTGGHQDSVWGKKCDWNSESGNAGGNQDSAWGKKGNLNSESGDTSGNQDSSWGKKSNWNSESGGNQDSGWGKRSNWNSESGGGSGNQDTTWGQKSNWNSESSNADQKSNWGGKSNWSSGSGWGSQSGDAGGEEQTEAFSGRPSGGNWRGGFGGRDGDRGFGFRGGDRGSFRGRGGDRGGFRGRGGDRGGFGGRGGDRGGFGGRGRSDRGGFGGRGGSDRGGFGGRGRGRRDQSGGWSNRDSSGNGSWWNKGEDNSGDTSKNNYGGAGCWNQGDGQKDEWQGGTAGNAETRNSSGGWSTQGKSWSQSAAGKDDGGWGKGTSSGSGAGGGWGNAWRGGNAASTETKNPLDGCSSQGGSSWSQSATGKDDGSWGKGAGPGWGNNSKSSGGTEWPSSSATNNQDGAWKGQNSGSWNKGTGSSTAGSGNWGNNNWKSPGDSGGTQRLSSTAAADQEGGYKGPSLEGSGWSHKGSGSGSGGGSWGHKGTGSSSGDGSWGNSGKSAIASTGWGKGSDSNTVGVGSWGNNGNATGASTNQEGGWKGPSSTVKAGNWGSHGSHGNGGGGSRNGGWNKDQVGISTRPSAADADHSSDVKERTDGSGSTDPWGKAADKSWGGGGGKGGW